MLEAVQPNRLLPAAAALLKKSWPTEQLAGSEVPTATAEPTPFMVWLGQVPVIVIFEPADKPGVEVPVPPLATDNGKVRLGPTVFHVLVEVHA